MASLRRLVACRRRHAVVDNPALSVFDDRWTAGPLIRLVRVVTIAPLRQPARIEGVVLCLDGRGGDG